MNFNNKLNIGFLGLMLILFSCMSDEKRKSEGFSWISETDTLHLVGKDVLSRPTAEIYNFAFTSEGDTIFFHTTDKGDGESGIAISSLTSSGWSKPRPAPFETDDFEEGHVSMSPDGKRLIFSSDRTDNLKGEPKSADDFFVVSQSSNWIDVKRISSTVKMSEKRGSLAKDGSFYYWAYQRGSGMYFFKAKISDDKIKDKQDARKMLFPDYSGENNPFVDPQHEYMLFAVYGRDERYDKEDIYISHRKNNSWSTPKILDEPINTKYNDTSPFVTPDGKYLFFVSDRLTSETDTIANRNLYVIKTDQLKALN
ncbi:PD40 domain-containing protein [Mesohalobacter halotolerans]|nr:PD40 domain-containing protein [Mesohalobacter halotolerans]